MGYLDRARSRVILACFVASSLILATFPEIDLFVSRLFFDGGFRFDGTWTQRLIRDATTAFLALTILGAVAAYALSRILRRNFAGVDGRRLCYLVAVLALGAGVIVNLALKDNFGRARPRDVVEFGGAQSFTPAFTVSGQCRKNCSFSSGEAAAAFFALAVGYAFGRRRRAAFVVAAGFGILVSVARIAAGAHFFSDAVVSFFVMWLLADSLHHHMRIAPEQAGAPRHRESLARIVERAPAMQRSRSRDR